MLSGAADVEWPTFAAPVFVLRRAGGAMTRLILTSLSGSSLKRKGEDTADVVIPFTFRFVWGKLPSSDQLASYLAKGSGKHAGGNHWSDFVSWPRDVGAPLLGLVAFCQNFETVELWFDPGPNDQLQLIWLLDHLHLHPDILPRLKLGLVSFDLNSSPLKGLGNWQVPVVDVTGKELETASRSWQAYRATTPEACFDLLGRDLSALPLLRPALTDLLNELPARTTGLGATEMRMLELVARGYSLTNALFHLYSLRRTNVFGEWEHGYLLDGLAFGPKPAVAGLDDALRTLDRENLGDRHKAYLRSRLSLTEFGKAIVAHQEDFSRPNPIDRWWGGTRLTNDNLWRWDPVLIAP
jgi:hypothetical protein